MMAMSPLPFPHLPATDLVAAGLFLRGLDDPRWLLLRATKHGEWGFPKGHADPGEDLIQTALRECVEETGIAVVEIVGAPTVATYTVPSGKRKVTVYYPAVTATDLVMLSAEHDRFRWCETAEVQRLLPHAALQRQFRQAVERWPC